MFTPKRMGLFGSARLGNGIMPGDQQSVDLGDFTGMANRGSTAAGEMMQGVGAPRPISTQPVDVMQGPELKPKGGGFFGSDGIGTTILGSIGDYLMQVNGLQPTFAPSQMLQRQQQFAAQRAEQQRAQEWEDWQRKQEWEATHRAPSAPHYWETNDGSLAMIGPDGQPKVLYKDPTPKTEYQTVRNPDGTITVYPMPQVGAPSSPKVIGSQLPPGWTVEGGPGGNAGGGFR